MLGNFTGICHLLTFLIEVRSSEIQDEVKQEDEINEVVGQNDLKMMKLRIKELTSKHNSRGTVTTFESTSITIQISQKMRL